MDMVNFRDRYVYSNRQNAESVIQSKHGTREVQRKINSSGSLLL